jgi:DNA repair exonuclease SbcCD ATPase subunit
VWLHDGGLYLADLLIPLPGEPEPVAEPEPERPPEPVAEPVVDEQPAKRVVEAWSEAAQLRDKLAAREEELAAALKELLELRTTLEAAKAEAAAAEQRRAELEEENRSRRAGISRRREDRDARRQIAELEAKLAEREQRIEALEAEAGNAPSAQLAALEEDARQRSATNDDLRALLESERETAAAARREVEDLKQQLATVSAEYAAKVTDPARATTPRVAVKPSPSGVQSPPWSALDDELLARIEKAKAVTS